MNKKDLNLFLVLQLFAMAWAGAVFSLFESRVLAGALAGAYFVSSGLFMVLRAWRWQDKWRSLGFYPLMIHVFLISIPMVVSRFAQIGSGFEQVQIFGLAGPVFHKMSSWIFMVLLVGTFADRLRLGRSARV